TPLAVCCCIAGVLLVFGPWAGVVGVAAAAVPWLVRPARVSASPGGGLVRIARSRLALLTALLVAAWDAGRGRWGVWPHPPRPPLAEPQGPGPPSAAPPRALARL